MKRLLDNFKISVLAGMITLNTAQAEPVIEFTNSKGKKIDLDCGELIIAPNNKGKKAPFMSCDFAEQLNPDGKNICSHTDNVPKSLTNMTKAQKYRSTQSTIDALLHFGRAHNDCVTRAANIDGRSKTKKYMNNGVSKKAAKEKAISEVEKLYGDDWKQKPSCTLRDAVKACEATMDLD